jgi:hypothetical protein
MASKSSTGLGKMKAVIENEVLLAYQDFDNQFLIYTDASNPK